VSLLSFFFPILRSFFFYSGFLLTDLGLRELLKINNIMIKKEPLFIVSKKNREKKQERANAKNNLKLQMQQAISEVN